ncbi:MAG: hypothetical protein E7283_03140 [Lachnospiraceae bacterium]|nr:hypothetical protein [Lachnospiraceae bacterium]
MLYTDAQVEFLKCMDFMRLGQAINHKQWQSASMIVRRLDDMAREAGINDFERAFTGIRQSINRKDIYEAKQIMAIVVNKRVKYLNDMKSREC